MREAGRESEIGRGCPLPNLESQPAPRLLDIDFNRFSGLSPQEAGAAYPRVYRARLEAPHTVRFPDGESLSDARAHAAGFLWEVAAHHGNQQVLMVSHLAVCRTLFCYLRDLPESHYWRFQLNTASVSIFAIAGSISDAATGQ
ncbi:MAG: histidine phosphatase family protein [Anaerolineae bacterium]